MTPPSNTDEELTDKRSFHRRESDNPKRRSQEYMDMELEALRSDIHAINGNITNYNTNWLKNNSIALILLVGSIMTILYNGSLAVNQIDDNNKVMEAHLISAKAIQKEVHILQNNQIKFDAYIVSSKQLYSNSFKTVNASLSRIENSINRDL